VDVDEAEVLFPALYAAEVGSVEAGCEGYIFLGLIPGFAEFADAFSETSLDPILLGFVHPQLVGILWTISLWTIIHILIGDFALSV
jgi:hypothetical protein